MLMLYGTCEGNWYPSTLRLSENGFGETHSTNRPMNMDLEKYEKLLL